MCYVIRSNHPIQVMEGFIRRIWKNSNVYKVALLKKGIYIVRFLSMDIIDKKKCRDIIVLVASL